MAESNGRRPFTITRLELHPEGYWHAFVSNGDETVHVHRRFGSWLAERRKAPRSRTFVMCDVPRPIAAALQEKVRPLEKRARR